MTPRAVAATATPSPPTKGERTRQRILEVAIELFRERGYEGTTMRLIASRAGVSLGNSYHHFPNKEHLVQAFYRLTCDVHIEACRPLLNREKDLRKRLVGVSRQRIATLEQYHDVAGALFASVANPASPLNPFSEESREIRDISIAFMAEVVAGSNAKLPKDIDAELPRLLWLHQLGLVLLWTHDRTPQQQLTTRVATTSVEMIMSLLTVAHLPLMRGTRRRLMAMITDIAGASTIDGAAD